MATRADIAAGRAFVELYVKSTEFAHGLLSAELRLKAFAGSVNSLAHIMAEWSPASILRGLTDSIAAMGTAVARTLDQIGDRLKAAGTQAIIYGGTVASVMAGAAAHFGHVGDSLWVLAQRTGAGTEALSGFGYAARQTGATIDDVETGLRAMQRTIGDAAGGSLTAAESLGKLGLSVEQLGSMSPEDQFQAIGDSLAAMEDPAQRTSAAMDVLGRSGQSLLPMLVGLQEFMGEARGLGLLVSPTQARLAEQLIDKFQALKEAAFAIVFSVGEALAPALLEAIKVATDLAIRFRSWVVENKATVLLIGKIALGLVTAGAAAGVIGAAFSGMGSVVGMLTGAFSIFGHMVSALMPIVTLLGVAVAVFGSGPILAFIGSIGSAVAASGLLGAALSAIGTIAAVVLPEIALIAGVLAAGFAAVVGTIGAVVTAAGLAAVAFWKLTDPIKSLAPLFRAIASGSIKQIMVAAAVSVLEMWRSAMSKIVSLTTEAGTKIRGVFDGIGKMIRRMFAELTPVVIAVFNAFYFSARDTFEQLPKLAGYAIGKMIRLAFDGLIAVQGMVGRVFIGLFDSIIKLFTNFVPLLAKAMTTGGTGGLEAMLTSAFMESIKKQAEALGAVVGGAFGGAAPEFKMSPETMAAFERLRGFLDKALPGSASSESHKNKPSDIALASSAKSFSTYSAVAAQALGRGSQAPTDRLLVEAREHRRISERMLALSRRSATVAERLAAGLAMR